MEVHSGLLVRENYCKKFFKRDHLKVRFQFPFCGFGNFLLFCIPSLSISLSAVNISVPPVLVLGPSVINFLAYF